MDSRRVQNLKGLGFGDSPAVYRWELWNEINAAGPHSAYAPWGVKALAELKRTFPNQLAVNNLGSFSSCSDYQHYEELVREKDNDFMQVHRYLDAGADIDACRGPMDIVTTSTFFSAGLPSTSTCGEAAQIFSRCLRRAIPTASARLAAPIFVKMA